MTNTTDLVPEDLMTDGAEEIFAVVESPLQGVGRRRPGHLMGVKKRVTTGVCQCGYLCVWLIVYVLWKYRAPSTGIRMRDGAGDGEKNSMNVSRLTRILRQEELSQLRHRRFMIRKYTDRF